MREQNCLLAPGLADLRALGVSDARELLGAGSDLVAGARPEPAAGGGRASVLRIAMAGAPGAGLAGRGGFARLKRYERASTGDVLWARFTAPRSTSLAAREWNLICHLRARGVGTPEPLAMGPRDAPFFARRSFLVTREVEQHAEPLHAWIVGRGPTERRRLARVLGLALRRTFDAGVWLPRLLPTQVFVNSSEQGSCGDAGAAVLGGMARSRVPAIAFTGFDRGRILRVISSSRRLRWLERFSAELPDASQPSPRELLRVALLALGRASDGTGRRARRAALRGRRREDSSRLARAPE